ncbi:MAG: hypothetical protein EOS14_10515 [Mesorhizobium sp.]|nr:MAG: hypothetical protein EOS14_10515 [Mesorhizobium sp.]
MAAFNRYDGQSEQQRETLASRIIANYMAGVVDEEELLSASKMGRQATASPEMRPARDIDGAAAVIRLYQRCEHPLIYSS